MSDLNTLVTIETSVKDFQKLNVFSLLANFPSNLLVSHFIASKDNASGLGGSSELFRACTFTASFDLPDPLLAPDPELYDESKAGMTKLRADLAVFKLDGKPFNDRLAVLRSSIDRLDIVRKYTNLRSAVDFVSKRDPSAFEIPVWTQDTVTDLAMLPSNVKALILTSYQEALEYAPYYLTAVKDGTQIPIDLALVNFQSINGVKELSAMKAKKLFTDKRQAPFFGFGMVNMIRKIKPLINESDLLFCISKFDAKIGASNNSNTTIDNFLKLFTVV